MQKYSYRLSVFENSGDLIKEIELDPAIVAPLLIELLDNAPAAPAPVPTFAGQVAVAVKKTAPKPAPKQAAAGRTWAVKHPCCGSKQNKHKPGCTGSASVLDKPVMLSEDEYDDLRGAMFQSDFVSSVYATKHGLAHKEVKDAITSEDYQDYLDNGQN